MVVLGCCSGCNGGTDVAAAASAADEVRRRYAEDCGFPFGPGGCTLMGCWPEVATCASGTCTLSQIRPSTSDTASP